MLNKDFCVVIQECVLIFCLYCGNNGIIIILIVIWIIQDMIEVYIQFYEFGLVYFVEVWDND